MYIKIKKVKKMKKYNILIPALDELIYLGTNLIKLKEQNSEYFRENLNSIDFYGKYSYCIWSQEPSNKNFVFFNNVESNLKYAKDNNIKIYYDFSNTQLSKNSVYDSYCNMLLSLSTEVCTSAIVYSPYLIKYIKEQYPDIKLIRPELYDNSISENDYDSYILNYENYKQNPDKILEQPKKYLIYLNSYGAANKELIDRKCNDIVEFNNINYNNYPSEVSTFEESKELSDFISVEDVEHLSDNGIENFIIRNCNYNFFEILESCIYYLIKPEYQNKIRLELIKLKV